MRRSLCPSEIKKRDKEGDRLVLNDITNKNNNTVLGAGSTKKDNNNGDDLVISRRPLFGFASTRI